MAYNARNSRVSRDGGEAEKSSDLSRLFACRPGATPVGFVSLLSLGTVNADLRSVDDRISRKARKDTNARIDEPLKNREIVKKKTQEKNARAILEDIIRTKALFLSL